MAFKKYSGNIAPCVLVTSSCENRNSTNLILFLQNLSHCKVRKKAERFTDDSGEGRQGAGRWAVWEWGTYLHSQVTGICPMRSKHKKVQKWQLKVKGSSQTLRGVGVDMPRDTKNHVTRSKGIFPERKVYIWAQMGINFSLTTDPLPMLYRGIEGLYK